MLTLSCALLRGTAETEPGSGGILNIESHVFPQQGLLFCEQPKCLSSSRSNREKLIIKKIKILKISDNTIFL